MKIPKSKPILVANWKNSPDSPDRAGALLTGLSRKSALYKKTAFFVAPPYPYFESVSKRTKSFANLASQDLFHITKGSHTGAVTIDMLKGFGVRLAILGHSERRALGETSETVSEKVRIALKSGIIPLVCIGEAHRDPDGEHLGALREDLRLSLESVRRKDDAGRLVIAYEPVWAIGKKAKDVITPADLAESVVFIKRVLSDMFGRETAERIPILYGGSVNPANAGMLYHETGVRGFLVGRESLDAEDLASIAESMVYKQE